MLCHAPPCTSRKTLQHSDDVQHLVAHDRRVGAVLLCGIRRRAGRLGVMLHPRAGRHVLCRRVRSPLQVYTQASQCAT